MGAAGRGILKVTFLLAAVLFLVLPTPGQGGEPNDVGAAVRTSRYVFQPEVSTLLQTGGIAGVNWPYTVAGQFCVSVDPNTGGAWFTQVYANAGDVSEPMRTLDPNEVFKLAGLVGTVVDDATIEFTGQVADCSGVLLTLTFEDDLVHLTGTRTPPSNGADFFVFTINAVATRKYAGGTGEPNDPYRIATAADLIALGDMPTDYDKHFALTADIDLKPNLPGRKVFSQAVIAPSVVVPKHILVVECEPFRGHFSGNGYTLRNVIIQAEGEWAAYIGLFGCVTGSISDLRLEDINIVGTSKVGGLTGYNKGTIATCSVSGSVAGETEVGIVAGMNEAIIVSCRVEGSVSADGNVGGLVGNHVAGTVAFSYSTAQVTGDIGVGGLIGVGEEGTVYLSYWDTDRSGVAFSAGGRGIHSAEMVIRETYRGWGYPEVWSLDEGREYPRLLWEAQDGEMIVDAPCSYGGGAGEPNDPFQIWSAGQLISIGYCPDDFNDCFVLMADIDLSHVDANEIVPIGTDRWPFQGLFEGNGHIISNLVCTLEGQNCVGLFGCVRDRYNWPSYESGHVRNLHLVDAIVAGGHLTGALVGENEGFVMDCHVTGVVQGCDHAGGLVGYNKGTVDNCRYGGSVKGEANVGGLCGSSYRSRTWAGQVQYSAASGSVAGLESAGGLIGRNWSYQSNVVSCHASSDVLATDKVGGLVGFNLGHIEESYATGNVTGETEVGGLVGANWEAIRACMCSGPVAGNTEVGGLVGRNKDTITSCYATSSISGESLVGGLIGYAFDGTVTYCYATGPVTADGSDVGGLIGGRLFSGSITAAFWNAETSAQVTSAGGKGFTTAEMQTAGTFLEAGWDFVGEAENGTEDIWWIDEGQGYPRLWWEPRKYGGGTGEPNDPYLVYTAEHLNAIGTDPNDWDRYFILTADIDLSGFAYGRALIAPDTDSVYGYQGTPFTGVFDGNGHAISHLAIVGQDYLGLFGLVREDGREEPTARIENLQVEDVSITGSGDCVGGLVGYSDGATLSHSSSTGTVSGEHTVGGLVGHNGGTVINCHSVSTVLGDSGVGGLVGKSNGILALCYSSGMVNGDWDVGGLVGSHRGTVTQSYSGGVVDGNDVIGGLIGRNWIRERTSYPGDVDRSYSFADVRGGTCVGGLVGSNRCGSVRQCYSTGSASGTEHVGGLVGARGLLDAATSFWDAETSGLSVSGGGEGKTTAEMQTASTFLEAGWDFVGEVENGTEDIWWIDEGQDYPRLWWEVGAEPPL